MTLVFNITTPERCQICHSPVRDCIYQHQCRQRVQPLSCFTCLVERDMCRYCSEPFTRLKYANSSWSGQTYYSRPDPRPEPKGVSDEEKYRLEQISAYENPEDNEIPDSMFDFITSSLYELEFEDTPGCIETHISGKFVVSTSLINTEYSPSCRGGIDYFDPEL